MNAAFRSRAFFLFRRRRLRILSARLRRHVQEPPRYPLHAAGDFFVRQLIVVANLFAHQNA
jgi:hypothetical protein